MPLFERAGLEGWERSRGISRSEGRDGPCGLASARRAAWWESVTKEKREFGKTGARGGGASELWRATHGLPAEPWRLRLMRAGVRRGRIDSSKKRDSHCLVRSSATKGAGSHAPCRVGGAGMCTRGMCSLGA